MSIEELLNGNTSDLLGEVLQRKTRKTKEYLDQYNPAGHDIYKTTKRKDKVIVTEDEAGNDVQDIVAVARISVPFQQIIVDRSAAFLVGEGVALDAMTESEAEATLLEMVEHTWNDSKLDYKTRQLARIWMTETECAELWYFLDRPEVWQGFKFGNGAGQRAMRCRILAPSLGDTLYPHFDEYGDMDAFAHEYEVNKEIYLDLYTANVIINYKKKGAWTEVNRTENLLGKIPVVYYDREKPEWEAVQPMIDRFETMISNLADNNDYFANPMIVVKGEVEGFAKKGEQGKILTTTGDAGVEYLTWDQAPQATIFEKDLLQELIFTGTQTPDISFAKMKGIGAVSGIALKLMFMDAKLKTLKHQETFGECVQRRINLLKKGMAIINTAMESVQSLQITPEFSFYLPDNEQELVNMLVTSTNQRQIMSQKTAVALNPFVSNPEVELEQIKEDEAGQFGNLFPEPPTPI
jgi:hypothetical protein